MNKMYLSFFLWGWIQVLFGAGLQAPRLFAALFSVLSVVGIWIVARRLSNRWLAALAVWVLIDQEWSSS
jgi:4-amino-4-deoxy-L-arabinose transferase-like glycosyltransferase